MKIVYAKRIDKYFPMMFPQSIKKNGKLEYFIRGNGYKQTKVFEVLDIDLPERSSEISWFDICLLMDKYGLQVANTYAECKTAGIVSVQTIKGYYIIYQAIKDVLPKNFDHEFFAMLSCDYMLSCFGMFLLDIVKLDEAFDKADPEYDQEKCLYKGRKASMDDYVKLKYGEDYKKVIDVIINVEREDAGLDPVDPDQLKMEL